MKHDIRRVKYFLIMFAVYAVLGAACSLCFAFLRSAFIVGFDWPMPYTFGYGKSQAGGAVWHWNRSTSLGMHACSTYVIDAAAPRMIISSTGPIGWYEGPAPWWSIAVEQPFPDPQWLAQPVGSSTSPGTSVLDTAFGWPFPCMSYRILNTGRRQTTIEIASFGSDPDTLIIDQTLILGSYRFSGIWKSLGLYDGFWPTHILWRGLAANSLALGLILALPQACFFIVRERRAAVRRRAIKCPWCGYNRTGLLHRSPCPECGGVEPTRLAT